MQALSAAACIASLHPPLGLKSKDRAANATLLTVDSVYAISYAHMQSVNPDESRRDMHRNASIARRSRLRQSRTDAIRPQTSHSVAHIRRRIMKHGARHKPPPEPRILTKLATSPSILPRPSPFYHTAVLLSVLYRFCSSSSLRCTLATALGLVLMCCDLFAPCLSAQRPMSALFLHGLGRLCCILLRSAPMLDLMICYHTRMTLLRLPMDLISTWLPPIIDVAFFAPFTLCRCLMIGLSTVHEH